MNIDLKEMKSQVCFNWSVFLFLALLKRWVIKSKMMLGWHFISQQLVST